MKLLTYPFLLILHLNDLGAQTNQAIFSHLTTQNGLSCNRASVVMQDRRGFYWIGTEDGLNRFDGSNCKVFRNIKNDSNSLSNNNCASILEDDFGDIWIGTHMGVNRYNYKENKFERFFLDRDDKSFDRVNMIRGLQKDSAGNIWIASIGLWQYNIHTKKWKRFIHQPRNASSIPEGTAWHLRYDRRSNGLWMNIEDSRVFFDIRANKFFHKQNNPFDNSLLKSQTGPYVLDGRGQIWFKDDQSNLSYYEMSNNSIQQTPYKISRGFFNLSADSANKIWIHHWGGKTIIFDPHRQVADSGFLSGSHPQSALSDRATSLYIDPTGIYWVASTMGVSIHNPAKQAIRYFMLPVDKKDIFGSVTTIYCLLEQDENTIWVGTNTGLYKYDILSNQTAQLIPSASDGDVIKCLYLQDDSVIWVGTKTRLCTIDAKTGKVIANLYNSIHTEFITGDTYKNIWVGTWHNGLYQFSPEGKLLNYFQATKNSAHTINYNNLIGVQTDPSRSHMWIGYNGGYGFSKLNYSSVNFEHYKIQTDDPYFTAINTVNCFSEDSAGNVWIGTNGGGLFYFDRDKNSFRSFTQSDGLKSHYINVILADENERLWITTSNGLSILNKKTEEITSTGIDLELNSNDFLPNGIQLKNKKLLFFSGAKLVEIDPVQFQQNNYPSKILFSSFKIFDKDYYLKEESANFKANLTHHQNFFSVEYSLLSPDPNSLINYAYRLEGFDNDWINAGERRVAYYTNVPPGNYTFLVRAIDESGKKHFSRSILISITPPFWKTWWFISLITIFICTAVYVVYRYRVIQIKKLHSLRSKISQDLHDDVGAALSGIKVFSQLAKQRPEVSTEYLEKINTYSDEMLTKMSDIVWSINTENDSFEHLIDKLQSYALTITAAKNINLEFTADSELKKRVPDLALRKNIYLIAKEAINNAVKYADCTFIQITLKTSRSGLRLTIADNGKGFNKNNTNGGNGLPNMKRRAEEMNGSFVVETAPARGTAIEVFFNFT